MVMSILHIGELRFRAGKKITHMYSRWYSQESDRPAHLTATLQLRKRASVGVAWGQSTLEERLDKCTVVACQEPPRPEGQPFPS